MSAPGSSPPRGVRVPKQARSRRTRERTLEAAAACFEELGYDETTTAEIARRAGVSVGSVYDYFHDKRSILLEILHDTVEVLADAVVKGLAPEAWRGADPREGVRQLVLHVFHARELQPGLQRILWERFFKDPEIRLATEAIEEKVRGAIRTLLEDFKAAGHLRVEDVATTAYVVHLSIEWVAARILLGDSEIDADAAAGAAADMVHRFIFQDGA